MIMDGPILHESCLVPRDNVRKDWREPASHDFGDDFEGEVEEVDRSKVIEG